MININKFQKQIHKITKRRINTQLKAIERNYPIRQTGKTFTYTINNIIKTIEVSSKSNYRKIRRIAREQLKRASYCENNIVFQKEYECKWVGNNK